MGIWSSLAAPFILAPIRPNCGSRAAAHSHSQRGKRESVPESGKDEIKEFWKAATVAMVEVNLTYFGELQCTYNQQVNSINSKRRKEKCICKQWVNQCKWSSVPLFHWDTFGLLVCLIHSFIHLLAQQCPSLFFPSLSLSLSLTHILFCAYSMSVCKEGKTKWNDVVDERLLLKTAVQWWREGGRGEGCKGTALRKWQRHESQSVLKATTTTKILQKKW